MGELGRRGSVPVRPEEAHKKPYSAPQLIPRLDALHENRRDLRFRLDVEVKIHSPSMGPVPGQTLDISERGLSALLPVELPLEEVVEVNLKLHIGRVNVRATIRNRNAFRHGFQFVEPNPALHLIRENCCFLEQIPTLNSAMEAEPEEKTLENGVRLRLYRGRQWTVGNQRLTGDGLEVSEPPDHLTRSVLIFANVLDSPRAEQAYKKQVVLTRETPKSDSGVEQSRLDSKLSGEDEARYLAYRRMFEP